MGMTSSSQADKLAARLGYAPRDRELFVVALTHRSADGPNNEREHSESNVGDVWVEAWYQPDPAKPPMGARAFMLLMPPKFVFNPIN